MQKTIGRQLAEKIGRISIPVNNMEDERCWGLTGSGVFSTKSATWLAHGLNMKEENTSYGWLWKVDVPPKIKIFLWQLQFQAWPVRHELRRRDMQINHECPLCEEEGEDINHF